MKSVKILCRHELLLAVLLAILLALAVPGAAQAISHGSESSRGHTFAITQGGASCSAVLITPVWALTAGHCVVASYEGMSAVPAGGMNVNDIEARFGDNKTSPTFTTGVEEYHFLKSPLDFNALPGDGDSDHDVALLKLEDRVPSSIAAPLLPPIGGLSGCSHSDEFTGVIVGYGDTSLTSASVPLKRRERTSSDWEWEAHGSYGIYWNTWPFPEPTGSLYHGVLPGDSGGPLIDSSGRLCGVASRYLPFTKWELLPVPIPIALMYAEYAAVDSTSATDWLKSHVMQGNGTFEGYCANNPAPNLDSDGDLTPDVCDNCIATPNDQTDSDGDGVGDVCDRCEGFDDTVDQDGDFCPDFPGCDPCLGEGDLGDVKTGNCGDDDQDSLCNSVDNCPQRPNFNQRNTNELSENVHTPATVLGDACEPVPQPRTRGISSKTVVESIDTSLWKAQTFHVETDEIEVTPLASHPKTGIVVFPVPVLGVETHFRYCQPSSTLDCEDPTVINDGQLHLNTSLETSTMPYHRITLTGLGPRGATALYSYNDLPKTPQHWDWAADQTFWITSGIMDISPPQLVPDGVTVSDLQGVLWVHAETGVGDTVDVGTGLHGAQLANHYLDLRPSYVATSSWIAPWQSAYPVLIELTLPDPGPEKFATLDSIQATVAVPTPGGYGLLGEDGWIQRQDRLVSPELLRSLSLKDRVWVAAAEGQRVGNRAAPVAVAVAADGSALLDLAFFDASRVSLRGAAAPEIAGLSAAPPEQPLPTDFAVAYSRYYSSVWIVGTALEPRSGRTRTTVVRAGVTERPFWVELPTAIDLGTVLSATVSFRDRGLYVLDEVGRERVRLVRLDALSGGGETLAEWPSRGRFKRLSLRLDRNGDLLLTSSSLRPGKGRNAIVRIELGSGEYRVDAFERRDALLTGPPIVGARGYGLFVLSGELASLELIQDLSPARLTLRQLGKLF